MVNKIRIYIAGALSLLVLLASCDGNKVVPREEFSTPEKTYRLWLETADKGDIPRNMECLSEASRRIMDEQLRNMDEFMRRMKSNVTVFKTYSVAEHRAKDDLAVVVLKGKRGEVLIVPFKKEAEGWKVDLISLFAGKG